MAGVATWNYISAGLYHTCGVASNGSALCWGENSFGELGDGSSAKRSVPTAVVNPAGVGSWRAVSAGFYHSCGVAANAAAYCWGECLQLPGMLHGGGREYGGPCWRGHLQAATQHVPDEVCIDESAQSLHRRVLHASPIASVCRKQRRQAAWRWGYQEHGRAHASGGGVELGAGICRLAPFVRLGNERLGVLLG